MTFSTLVLSQFRVTLGRVFNWILDILSTSRFYNTIAHFHILPITPAHAKSFQSAFTRRFLSMDVNTVTITNDTINKAMAETLNLF
jgi:hypothetical protein